MRTAKSSALLAACLLPLALPAGADTAPATVLHLELTPETTAVGFELPATGHDVHGSIPLERGLLELDLAAATASGEIVLDPAAARSGNDSRDKTMRTKVFEIARFPKIVFHPERIDGALSPSGHSEVAIAGSVDIHGATRPVALVTAFDLGDGRLAAHGTLTVPFVAWGMPDPSVLFLRVAKEVLVRVDVELPLPAAAAPAAP